MRATVMHGAGDVRIETVPDATLLERTDALVQNETMPASQLAFYNNVTVSGGPAPVRAYMEELLPDILEGRIEPGRVFDRTVDLDGVPEGYRAMADRESINVMVTP